ncbi:MAG: hypothetical protein A3C30_00415 [Candidatus Levybacteria bacterium RIFCSPHIGHO2_02_FULL_40_18]|nr:MAG: hypothetical protein A2869_04110 [Candidatus Levybacteria bacterium RIFCSPHIGHO2_01_FULL_40_58]OGH27167.1 MAG: hypothetical protein A3C30_00415 [Candidatus Levybacteria bacterium RIFCSPHIGHO2_02_FULL_40_18]OGH31026.1 MAG: hypothetical protein A3E43_04830 [Candidatus Levybacteria bacterium RIFCSPHIGHO2_12_FULL_40_31]OGH41037.1 MAG: hypothetical protein A2894_02045 [Candidatus Levybacteria bacterium RIFCSPLOWO2_01_FULL_40_64]OGH49443.1 MAG: hypothetical protein A3I54_02250 [Candidatus Lev
MSAKRDVLATGEIYHIFNKSVGNETIFSSLRHLTQIVNSVDFYRYQQSMRYSKFKQMTIKLRDSYLSGVKDHFPLVEIYAFAFMPNHYHLLVEQLRDDGIKIFASNVQNSFAKYFNTKHDRNGSLFQNPFKSRRIEDTEDFMHISRYIHLNPVTAHIIEVGDLKNYPYTSYQFYFQDKSASFVKTEFLLNIFGGSKKYSEFINDGVGYQRNLAKIKNLILE